MTASLPLNFPLWALFNTFTKRSDAIQVNASLATAVESHRGPVGDLLASELNLDLEISQIDTVNQSLESLGSDLAVSHGAI